MLVPTTRITSKRKLTPIENDWLLDIIDERFDDAISMLDTNCIIYGGAVRDALANLPLVGDLDILVSEWARGNIINNFSISARWVGKKKDKDYDKLPNNLISKVNTYINGNQCEVQIISPTIKNNFKIEDFEADLLHVVEVVDIVCCGVMTDIYGNVYEVVKGAFEDCKNKVLTLNKQVEFNKDTYKQLCSRINKLEKRGWVNHINLDKIEVKK